MRPRESGIPQLKDRRTLRSPRRSSVRHPTSTADSTPSAWCCSTVSAPAERASGVDLGRIGAECDRDRAIADVRLAPEDVASPAYPSRSPEQ